MRSRTGECYPGGGDDRQMMVLEVCGMTSHTAHRGQQGRTAHGAQGAAGQAGSLPAADWTATRSAAACPARLREGGVGWGGWVGTQGGHAAAASVSHSLAGYSSRLAGACSTMHAFIHPTSMPLPLPRPT